MIESLNVDSSPIEIGVSKHCCHVCGVFIKEIKHNFPKAIGSVWTTGKGAGRMEIPHPPRKRRRMFKKLSQNWRRRRSMSWGAMQTPNVGAIPFRPGDVTYNKIWFGTNLHILTDTLVFSTDYYAIQQRFLCSESLGNLLASNFGIDTHEIKGICDAGERDQSDPDGWKKSHGDWRAVGAREIWIAPWLLKDAMTR